MNERQRFVATMHYQARDRSPICDFGFWPETIEEWHKQGLPKRVTYKNYGGIKTDEFFGMDKWGGGPGVNVGLSPGFEYKVIEDRGDHEVVQQGDGVRVLRKKYMGSIPTHEGHTLVDRQSWKEHYKWRLDPDDPRRYPEKWDEAKRIWQDNNRETLVTLWGGSLFGWFRDWMGLEAISYVVYDDPAWFEEMVTTAGDCIVGTLSRVLKPGHVFDGCGMWEDMCYNGGPLLSPEHFKRYLVPQYKRITSLLRAHGVDTIWVDCDGKIDELIPLWLEAGVNCMFPIEVGTWGADPIKYRKQYGKEMLMLGGFDKHILARSKEAIRAEVLRFVPLVEEGGFIGFADHRVPPDVPLENYMYYLECAREIWGKGVNLKPMGKIRKVRAPEAVAGGVGRVKRQYYLDLAARGLRMPIGADLVLHEKAEHEAIRLEGKRLGAVVAEAAGRYKTPLAVPLMDLTLEKAALLGMLGIPYAEAAKYHFAEGIGPEVLGKVQEHLGDALDERSKAQVEAIRYVAGSGAGLVPIGMCIGPFSLMTKLLADPITPVYLAGDGVTAAEDPDVQKLERALALSQAIIRRSLARQIEAGAKAILIAEPAANVAFISPKQIDAGSDVWERFVMGPNRQVRRQLDEAGVDLIFHCCGEIYERMLVGFATLDPVILSLGSSRKLWEDAELMPETTVLYGNLPTKRFYSEALAQEEVVRMTRELLANMRHAGHPFILGSECDVLSVAGSEQQIRSKVDAMMNCPGH